MSFFSQSPRTSASVVAPRNSYRLFTRLTAAFFVFSLLMPQTSLAQESSVEPAVFTPESMSRMVHSYSDEDNGIFLHQHDFSLPPGKNNVTPDLKLDYNSSDTSLDSLVSIGWSFNIPSIKRINKTGIEKMHSETDFYSSLDGELINKGNGVYAPRTERVVFLSTSIQMMRGQ